MTPSATGDEKTGVQTFGFFRQRFGEQIRSSSPQRILSSENMGRSSHNKKLTSDRHEIRRVRTCPRVNCELLSVFALSAFPQILYPRANPGAKYALNVPVTRSTQSASRLTAEGTPTVYRP